MYNSGIKHLTLILRIKIWC